MQASFDVLIEEWGLTIRGCTLFKKESRTWVSLPGRTYQDKEGKTKSVNTVVFDKARNERFQRAVLDKIAAGNYLTKPDRTENPNLPF